MDAADPDTFITGVAAVLSDYPADVVRTVCDPRTGLPGKQAFPPSPFEVKQACEAEVEPIRRSLERRRQWEEQLERRKELPAPRPTLEELQERCGGKHWGIAQHGSGKDTGLTEAQIKAKAEAQLEAWKEASPFADIPNLPAEGEVLLRALKSREL